MESKPLSIGLALVASVLVISSCGPASTKPTGLPTAPPTEPPASAPTSTPTAVVLEVPDPTCARDAALDFVGEHFPEQAAPEQGWTQKDVTEEDLVGSSSFQYTAGGWVVTVSFPIVAPSATNYKVIAANEATGFQWEGEVDAAGQVKELTVVQAPDVIFEGVSFSYGDSMASDVVPDVRSATGPAGPDRAEWEVEPAHTRFVIQDYVLPETFHEPRIVVYPVGEFEGASEMTARIIAAVRQTLADRPDVPQPNPIVPPFNAGQLMSAQLAYVDFANGSGFRFLTQMGQAYAPINNHELFFAFQGLTDDGQWYVAAILPVAHPSLPANGTEIPGDDFEAFAQDFEGYVAEIEEQLNAENAGSFTPDLSLLDAMISSFEITKRAPTAAGQPVACWYGRIESTPADAAIDDYLILLPEEARRALDVVGADANIETEIEGLRDTGTYAHFWGTLHCRVPAWGGCQLIVTRMRAEGPDGPFFDPVPVDGWSGSVFSTKADAQFDDYFVRSGGVPMRYGIDSVEPAVASQLERLRDAPAIVRVWGQVSCPAIDYQGSHLLVDRVEIVEEASAEQGYEGWKPYLNERFGYAVWYPAECVVMGANLDDGVQFATREWPVLSISHFGSGFYRPAAGTDLQQWITDHVQSYDSVDTETQIAGLPTVHLVYEASPQAHAYDEYYFVRDGQLFRIHILHSGGQQDWELYNAFLNGFGFSSEPAAVTGLPVVAWGG